MCIRDRYEDLVSTPKEELCRIGKYLNIEHLEAIDGQTLPTNTGGKLGDQTGRIKFSKITQASSNHWSGSIDNWYRRRWLQKYFSGTRAKVLEELGYTVEVEQLKGSPRIIDGCLDYCRATLRSIKRNRSPKSRKLERHYTKANVHHISFR